MPRALLHLLTAVAVVAAAWATIVPPWQTPDEQAHFAFVQTLAETGDLPNGRQGAPASTEQEVAMRAMHAQGLAGRLELKPSWSERAYEGWALADARLADELREDAGDKNPASANPPLYYAYEAVPYLVAGGSVFDRLYWARIWSVLLLMAAAVFTWLLAGEIFGRERLLQLAAAALVGLQPMSAFIGGSVNPDTMVTASFAMAFWLAVRILKRGLSPAAAGGLVLAVFAAAQAKPVGWTLVPAAVFTLGVAAWARLEPAPDGARRLARALIPIGSATITAGAIAVLLDRPLDPASTLEGASAGSPGGFVSYLWQFYLPRLPFQEEIEGLPDYALYDSWVTTGWAAFGWLEIRFPEWVYGTLAGISALILFGGGWLAIRRRPSPAITVVFALVVVGLLGGLHWTEYKFLNGVGQTFVQGRYLLPLLPLGALLAASLIERLAHARRATAVAVLVGGLAALNLFALAITAARFYA